MLFSAELARKLRISGVAANALHPGVVSTAFGAEDPGRTQRLLVPFLRPFMRSPARGAVTSIRVASAPDIEGVTGRYFANGKEKRPSERGDDEAVAGRGASASTWSARARAEGREPHVPARAAPFRSGCLDRYPGGSRLRVVTSR